MGQYTKRMQGDRLRFSAKLYNRLVDIVQASNGEQFDLEGGSSRTVLRTGICLVRNDTEATVDRFHVLSLEAPLILPSDNEDEFQNRVAFKGKTPDATKHQGKFAVLLEPLGAGKIGFGLVSGVTVAKVNVNSEGDTHADIKDGQTLLESGGSGSAMILWKETGTGEKWALVRVSNQGNLLVEVKLTGKAAGGGKYSGKIMKGKSAATATGDLAMPEGLSEGVDCLYVNTEEDGLPTHWLATGGADGYAYVQGLIVGMTDEGSLSKPIVMGHGGKARLATPSTMGSNSEGSEDAETDSWQRRQVAAGNVKGDCPLEVYIMTRPPVYKDDGSKSLLCFMRKALIAADGRWDFIDAETAATIFTTCEHV